MIKRVDEAVYLTIKNFSSGNFKGGVITYGLKDKGVGYVFDDNNKEFFSDEVITKLKDIEKMIIDEQINVSDK